MSAAAKREGTENGLYKVEEDTSAAEDPTFSAATRVGERAYDEIAKLMSFAADGIREVETLPPVSGPGEINVPSGIRRASRETPTVPAPPIESSHASDEPPVEHTELLVTSSAGPALVPLSASPVPITISAATAAPVPQPMPRARWRFWSIETLVFGLAFGATAALVMGGALLLLRR